MAPNLDLQVFFSKSGTRCTLRRSLVQDAAERIGRMVTAEEHSVIGGLGGAVAESLAGAKPARLAKVGLPDTIACAGLDPGSLMDVFAPSVAGVVNISKKVDDH